MTRTRKVLLGLLLVFVAIQFVQPVRNNIGQASTKDFTAIYPVPQTVQVLLLNACYDCHSNDTRYPWYARLQPVGWLLAYHITEGRKHLNFDTFGQLSPRRQASRLQEIANQVKNNEMPLSSYQWMHPDARLSEQDKKLLITWMESRADSLLNQ